MKLRRASLKAVVARLTVAVLVAACLTTAVVVAESATTEPAAAASLGGDFNAGFIISDQNFYNSVSMSQADVQNFLNAEEPACRATSGPTCLRSYTVATTARLDSGGNCATYPGGGTQTAAAVIVNVGLSCGISPKVLLVLLEKEQGLVSSTAPTASMYRSATGYGCPDTAACDSTYYGFFNQVYMAALQFKRYAASPNSWSYAAGRTNNVLYSPNAACGTKSVYIQNQATASLYIYTPYTPDAAALANLYGTGDSCSAYGNRNFWRTYSDWFGSPTGTAVPFGYVDSVTVGYQQAVVSGWTAASDSTNANRVDFYVDGKGAASTSANLARPDLASSLGSSNTNHGYSATLTGLSAGGHQVCAYAINTVTSDTTLLACRTFAILGGDPIGLTDQLAAYPGALFVRGWVIDPDSTEPATVQVSVDGTVKATLTGDQAKASLATSYPGYGANHEYSGTVTGVSVGSHTVCITGVNTGPGSNADLGCQTVTMPTGNPWLNVDQDESLSPGAITVRGWAIDPDTISPVRVDVYVDGKGVASVPAADPKASLATAYYGYGANHQFTANITGLSTGSHQVCIYAIDVGPGDNSYRCDTVTSPTGSPALNIDQEAGVDLGSITLRGWAVDPDTVAAVRVDVYVDGRGWASLPASDAKASLATAFPGYGANHQFSTQLTGLGPGSHQVCVYAINVGGGSNSINCNTVSMLTGSPAFLLDQSSGGAGNTVTVRGWAIDPDTAAAVRIDTYIDGMGANSLYASDLKPSLLAAYAG